MEDDILRTAHNLLNDCKVDGFIISTASLPLSPANRDDVEKVKIEGKLIADQLVDLKKKPPFVACNNDNVYLGVIIIPTRSSVLRSLRYQDSSSTDEQLYQSYAKLFEEIDSSYILLNYNLFAGAIHSKDSISKSVQVPISLTALDIVQASVKIPQSVMKVTIPPSDQYSLGCIVIYKRASLQVPKLYTNKTLSLTFNIQFSYHSDVELLQQNKSIRNIIEEYRYQSHSEPVRDVSTDVIVRNAFHITSQAVEQRSSCSSIWTVTVENTQSLGSLLIKDVFINLNSSIRVESRYVTGNEEYDGEDTILAGSSLYNDSSAESAYDIDDNIIFNYAISSESQDAKRLSSIFTIFPLISESEFPILISAGESYSFVFIVSMNHSYYLQCPIDDLIVKYLTQLSIWWCIVDSKAAPSVSSTDVDSLVPVPHDYRILWSVSNDFLGRESRESTEKQVLSAQSRFSASDLILSLDIPTTNVLVNNPCTVTVTLENRSSRAFRQLCIYRCEDSSRFEPSIL